MRISLFLLLLLLVLLIYRGLATPPTLGRWLEKIPLRELYEFNGGGQYEKEVASYGPISGLTLSEYPTRFVPASSLPIRAYYDGKNAMLLCVPEVFPSAEGKAFLREGIGINDYSTSQATLYTKFLIFGDGAFPVPKSGVYAYLGSSKDGMRKAKIIISRTMKTEIAFLVYDGAKEWEIANVKFQFKRGQPFDGILNLPIHYHAQFPLMRSFHDIDWENDQMP